jgi:putative transcriptional regulator
LKYTPNTIDTRLKELGISQAELARRIGIEQPTVSKLVKGMYQPGVTTAVRVALALGTTVENLWPPDETFV